MLYYYVLHSMRCSLLTVTALYCVVSSHTLLHSRGESGPSSCYTTALILLRRALARRPPRRSDALSVTRSCARRARRCVSRTLELHARASWTKSAPPHEPLRPPTINFARPQVRLPRFADRSCERRARRCASYHRSNVWDESGCGAPPSLGAQRYLTRLPRIQLGLRSQVRPGYRA